MSKLNYRVGMSFHGTVGRERNNTYQYFDLGNTESREVTPEEENKFKEIAHNRLKTLKAKNIDTVVLQFNENEELLDGINLTNIMPKFKKELTT